MVSMNANVFGVSVSPEEISHNNGLSIAFLPLKIIALIVSYLDNVADLARICRTCRVFNYMALPLLYRNLTLTTYNTIRSRDNPGISGRGSTLSTGMNAIVTGKLGALVHSLTLQGEWREDSLDEDMEGGMVPDSLMILNIAVRAAIDKTLRLETFSWKLDNKTLDTVYIGLSQLSSLTSLTLRFPSTRHQRPITVIPAMPHLTSLKVMNIDPHCYPDDISALLLYSRKLEELKMQWSPRMKEAQELSVSLHDYFHRCITAKSPLRIKKLGFQNLYSSYTNDLFQAISQEKIEDITILNSSSCCFAMLLGEESSPPRSPSPRLRFKSVRHDNPSKSHCDFLGSISGLEKIYFINQLQPAQHYITRPTPTSESPTKTAVSQLPQEDTDTIRVIPNGGPDRAVPDVAHSPQSTACSPKAQNQLRDAYFSVIIANHGPWLRHLLLSSKWLLSASMIARLVHACPNLEQLALATETSSFDTMTLLVPFLRKLVAIRVLIPTGNAVVVSPGTADRSSKTNKNPVTNSGSTPLPLMSRPLAEVVELDESIHKERISSTFADKEVFGRIKLVGLGWKSYELGETYAVPAPASRPPSIPGSPAPQFRPTRRTSTPAAKPNAAVLQSSLGKRTRELRSWSIPSIQEQPNGVHITQPTENNRENHSTTNGEAEQGKVIWRRRIWRVGWDVLKDWEIWSMDGPDI